MAMDGSEGVPVLESLQLLGIEFLAEWDALAELAQADTRAGTVDRDFPGGIRARRDGQQLVLRTTGSRER